MTEFVPASRDEATHVLVVKDPNPDHIGRTYPILTKDMNDVIVDIGNGRTRIVYEDEHEWRKAASP